MNRTTFTNKEGSSDVSLRSTPGRHPGGGNPRRPTRKGLALVLSLALVPVAFAHLDEGEDRVVGPYILDFGWTPETPKAGEPTIFAINLVNESTQEVIEPAKVWVRISKEDTIIFTGTFHPEARHINFQTTFPESGVYEMTARFFDEELLAETDVRFDVAAGTLPYDVKEGNSLGTGLAIFFIIALFVTIVLQVYIVSKRK